MSKFKSFMRSVGVFADKAAKETVKMTDVGATKVKIKAEEARLCDRYEALGKAAEEYLRSDGALPEKIAAALSDIDKEKDKIAALKEELSEKKEKYSAEKNKEESN